MNEILYNEVMKRIALLSLLLCLSASPVWAQDGKREMGEITEQPLCARIVNEAPYTVFGSVRTDYFPRPDGIMTRHESHFRLKPDTFNEFCASGPFYEGRTVDFVIRTLIPVFSCKTGLGGDIVIHGKIKPGGGTESWADCLPGTVTP